MAATVKIVDGHLRKLEIEYDPRGGVLVVTPPGEVPIFSFFGRTGQKLDDLAKHWGCSSEEAVHTVVNTVHELWERDPAARKGLIQAAFLLREFGSQEEGDAFLDLSSRRRKPRTKPGPPDIEELRRLLVPPSKRRRKRKDLPKLFVD